LAVIVDVGDSKTEVSLIENADDSIREIQTVGSADIGAAAVRDSIVEQLLPLVGQQVGVVSQALRAELAARTDAALRTDRRISCDLGNGKRFERVITADEIAAASAPLGVRVRKFIHEVLLGTGSREIRTVRCIGGGTKLPVVAEAVQAAFPGVSVRQMNPDNALSSGAAIDCASHMNRLPRHLQTKVTTVAPYSIGFTPHAGTVVFLVQRGESLPADYEDVWATIEDFQTVVHFQICQGEHLLHELNDQLGTVIMEDLPRVQRGQCHIRVRIRYDDEGILQFSAAEVQSGRMIQARLQANVEFAESDESRLSPRLPSDAADEAMIAEQRTAWSCFDLDVRCAEQAREGPTEEWRRWLEANKAAKIETIRAKHRQAIPLLRMSSWPLKYKYACLVDFQLTEISPTSPEVARNGRGFIRFLCAPEFVVESGIILDLSARTTTSSIKVGRFRRGDRIEHVIQVCFPKNGRYGVSFRLADRDGYVVTFPLRHFGRTYWRFDVSGCPASDGPPSPIGCPAYLTFDPPLASQQVLASQYTFASKFQGGRLSVTATPNQGQTDPPVLATATSQGVAGDWQDQRGVISFPRAGRWNVAFAVDGFHSFTQAVDVR
jgi:hypothetical protein